MKKQRQRKRKDNEEAKTVEKSGQEKRIKKAGWIKMEIENSIYAQKAMGLFKEGYNCSQSVFLAFSDKYQMDKETASRIA